MPNNQDKRGRKKVSNPIVGTFMPRTFELLESPVWQALSFVAWRVLHRIEMEYGRHGGQPNENGRLAVTYDDFMAVGISEKSIPPALRELEALGLIECTEHGGGGKSLARKPNRYRLTYRAGFGARGEYRHSDDADGTHEWRRFKTAEQAEEAADRARAAKSAPRPKRKSPPPLNGGPVTPLGWGTTKGHCPPLDGEPSGPPLNGGAYKILGGEPESAGFVSEVGSGSSEAGSPADANPLPFTPSLKRRYDKNAGIRRVLAEVRSGEPIPDAA
jgi:DNA-binding PadR family transcriptional regulator